MSHAEHPHDDERDEFDAIVARLRDEGWPESGPDDATTEESPASPTDPLADLPTQWRMPTEEAPSILDEEEFVPPEPRALPSGDLGFWGAVIGLGGGILWLFYLFFFDRYARPLWWLLALATALTGLVLVFLRQPDRRDDDWDDDVDGAVL